MKHYFFIIMLFSTLFLEAKITSEKNYLIKYEYLNYSVSPEIGLKRYEILLKNKKITQILDLKSARIIPIKKAFGIKELITTIEKNNISLPYQKKINPYSTLIIDKIKKVHSSYTLNPLVERYQELKENYKKWLAKRVKKYKINVQDSRFPQYKEGIELTIENGKVTKARDIKSYQKIPIEKSFLTIKKLFGIAKWGLKDAIIDYDRKFFFPNLIIIKKPSITLKINAFEALP